MSFTNYGRYYLRGGKSLITVVEFNGVDHGAVFPMATVSPDPIVVEEATAEALRVFKLQVSNFTKQMTFLTNEESDGFTTYSDPFYSYHVTVKNVGNTNIWFSMEGTWQK